MQLVTDSAIKENILKNLDFSDMFATDILSISTVHSASKGEYIIQEGEFEDNLFIFLSGKLKVFTVSSAGKNITFGVIKDQCLIGEVATLWQQPPVANVLATEISYFLKIPLAEHRETLLSDNIFLRNLCKNMSGKITSLNNRFANIVAVSCEVRLSAFILQNCDSEGCISFELTDTA